MIEGWMSETLLRQRVRISKVINRLEGMIDGGFTGDKVNWCIDKLGDVNESLGLIADAVKNDISDNPMEDDLK